MNHAMLCSRSEIFFDDLKTKVDKKCFFLLGGNNDLTAAIHLKLKINIFDNPYLEKQINVEFTID